MRDVRVRLRSVLVVVVIAATLSAMVPAGASAAPPADVAAASGAGEPAARQAPLPPAREDFPPCSSERREFCIVSFEMDIGGSGLWSAPPDGIVVEAELWASWEDRDSFNLDLRSNVPPDSFSQELAPTVPAGTAVRIVVNTGSWEPPPTMSSSARVQEWSRALGADGWTMTFELATNGSSVATGCSTSECTVERGEVDYSSRASAVVWGIWPGLSAEEVAVQELSTGAWVATNASAFSNGYYDAESGR